MFVVKDKRLLDELMISLQFVNVGLIIDDILLILLEMIHLVFQGTANVYRYATNLLNRNENKIYINISPVI